MKPPPLTPEEIKAIADKAQARSAAGKNTGEPSPNGAQQFVAAALTEGEINVEIERLAGLPWSEYEHGRVAAAKRLGVRAAILDKIVAAARQRAEGGEDAGCGVELITRPPCETEVDGPELLAAIVEQIGLHIYLSENAKVAVALWIVASHAFDSFYVFPRLRLKSPTKGCGKSTLLDIIEHLVNKPLTPSNATGPTLFRVIAVQRPTLLLDEGDRYIREASGDLVSVIDAGHKKNGTVLRCVGDHNEPRCFSVWAPMTIAAIRSLPGTIEDRSIMIGMERKPPGVKLRRFRGDRPPNELAELASQIARWAIDHQVALSNADPNMPNGLSNRAADNLLPLLAVADAIGGIWPAKARAAAVAIQQAAGSDDELGITLLADIREVFGGDAMHSADLVQALINKEGSPWGEITHGRPLTQDKLGKLLRDFGIYPEQIKINGMNRRGYQRTAFEKAFAAYLPAQASGLSSQGATAATAFEPAQKAKSDLYRDLLPAINSSRSRLWAASTSAASSCSRGKAFAASRISRARTLACKPWAPLSTCSSRPWQYMWGSIRLRISAGSPAYLRGRWSCLRQERSMPSWAFRQSRRSCGHEASLGSSSTVCATGPGRSISAACWPRTQNSCGSTPSRPSACCARSSRLPSFVRRSRNGQLSASSMEDLRSGMTLRSKRSRTFPMRDGATTTPRTPSATTPCGCTRPKWSNHRRAGSWRRARIGASGTSSSAS